MEDGDFRMIAIISSRFSKNPEADSYSQFLTAEKTDRIRCTSDSHSTVECRDRGTPEVREILLLHCESGRDEHLPLQADESVSESDHQEDGSESGNGLHQGPFRVRNFRYLASYSNLEIWKTNSMVWKCLSSCEDPRFYPSPHIVGKSSACSISK